MQTVRQRKLKLLVFYPTSNPSPRPAGGAHGGGSWMSIRARARQSTTFRGSLLAIKEYGNRSCHVSVVSKGYAWPHGHNQGIVLFKESGAMGL
jgi:hypothetical protein